MLLSFQILQSYVTVYFTLHSALTLSMLLGTKLINFILHPVSPQRIYVMINLTAMSSRISHLCINVRQNRQSTQSIVFSQKKRFFRCSKRYDDIHPTQQVNLPRAHPDFSRYRIELLFCPLYSFFIPAHVSLNSGQYTNCIFIFIRHSRVGNNIYFDQSLFFNSYNNS